MKILADENMPYATELFSEFGQVTTFPGRQLSTGDVMDADVLLVRSITKVNEALLGDADKLQFVGTATIGTDHIDQAYLAERDIEFTSAPGCNAISVAEYVLSSLLVLAQKYGFDVKDKVVGIVGAGNTGSRLAEKLEAFGVRYLLCDPPLEAQGDSRDFVSYQTLLDEADVLSFHVPLIDGGSNPTRHLFNADTLKTIKPDAILINACRGEVMDNQALLEAKQSGSAHPLVLDVWEGEPNVLKPLIPYADIASAHIAGYSFEGKARGTFMLYQKFCQRLGVEPKQTLTQLLPPADMGEVVLGSEGPDTINRLVHLVYDVRRDDALFRQHIGVNGFDWLRKNYPVRREFSALSIRSQDGATNHLSKATRNTLGGLGFDLGG